MSREWNRTKQEVRWHVAQVLPRLPLTETESELDSMNNEKRGAQYLYPDSFIQLLGYMSAYFHLPYRQAEGVVMAHAGNKVPSIPNYSTINRRINNQDVRISDQKHVGNDDIIIAIDSTGIKIANRGEWIRHR